MSDKRNQNENNTRHEYCFYSKLLKKPFDSIEELRIAEKAYYAEQKAKEDATAIKRADAAKVEDAFKALNRARRTTKQDIQTLTANYCEDLRKLEETLKAEKAKVYEYLKATEETYEIALKDFTNKYGSFHMTLKDEDCGCATTITREEKPTSTETPAISDILDLLFRFK